MLNSSSYQNEFTLRTLLKSIEVLDSLTVASILAVVLFNPLMTFFPPISLAGGLFRTSLS